MDSPAPTLTTFRRLPGPFANVAPQVSLHTDKGTFFLFLPTRDVVLTQFHAHIDMKGAEALRDFGNQQFTRGVRVRFFHDWDQVTGYDSEARIMLTRWAIDRRASIHDVVVLTQSRLVAMGVATANLATSVFGVSMRCHMKRSAFDQELLNATATARTA